MAIDTPGLRDQRIRLYAREDHGADGFPRPLYVFVGEWWGRLDVGSSNTRIGSSPQSAFEDQDTARLTLAYYAEVPSDGIALVGETAFMIRGTVRDRLTWRTTVTVDRVATDRVARYTTYDAVGDSAEYHLVDPPAPAILLESGGAILLESGARLLLE